MYNSMQSVRRNQLDAVAYNIYISPMTIVSGTENYKRLDHMPRVCLQLVIVVFPDRTHLLFLILTNEQSMLSNLQYKPGLGKSYHLVVEFTYSCNIKSSDIPSKNIFFKRKTGRKHLGARFVGNQPVRSMGNTYKETYSISRTKCTSK